MHVAQWNLSRLLPAISNCFKEIVWLRMARCNAMMNCVSCSGFGLPLHAQLLRLFVTMMNCVHCGGMWPEASPVLLTGTPFYAPVFKYKRQQHAPTYAQTFIKASVYSQDASNGSLQNIGRLTPRHQSLYFVQPYMLLTLF